MATFSPPVFPPERARDPKLAGELLVWETLKRTLPDPWFVIYSLEWAGRAAPGAAPANGEADFVVAHPDRGLVVLEVKGGRVRVDEDQGWLSIDRDGVAYPIKPFAQAKRSLFAIKDKLKKLDGWAALPNVPGVQAIVLPDVAHERLPVSTEFAPEMIVQGHDLERLAARIDALLPAGDAHFPEPLDRVLRALVHPVWAPRERVGPQVAADRAHFDRLGDDQLEVLDSFELYPRLAVQGVPGSGKTALALHMARRLAAQGKRTLLTCYNKRLAAYLRDNAGDAPGLTVTNFHDLCVKLATAAGCAPPMPVPPDAAYFDALPQALEDAVRRRPEQRFDAVVVDEGQDFRPEWWIPLEAAAVLGERAPLYVFYDPQQCIYEQHPEFPSGLSPYRLTANRRNTKPIAQLVDELLGTQSVYKGPDGRPVERIRAAPGHDQLDALGKLLKQLVHDDKVAPADIAVLSPQRKESRVVDATCGGFKIVETPAGPKDIAFGTIQGYKGLERPVVVLVELDDESHFTWAPKRRLVGVGASRAKSHLVMLGASV